MKHVQLLAIFVFAAAACGGSQDSAKTQSALAGNQAAVSDDLDVPDEQNSAAQANESQSQQDGLAATGEEPAAEAPPVTFKLVNKADEDLVLSLDKGWQPIIVAYSGEPPNAKSILMFPTHCTASCALAAAERCPVCVEPEKVKDIKAAEKREVIAPGAALDVPWDGQIFVYEKTKGKQDGKSKSCECYRTEPVPENTYTVRACGLRLTKSAKASTKIQCIKGSMTLPAEGPQVVELEFGAK